MTTAQKVIKYLAIALAIILIASIISGIVSTVTRLIGFFVPDTGNGEVSVYDFSDRQISSLEIDVEAAELTLSVGDTPCVECSSSRVDVKLVGDTLRIVEADTLFHRTDIYELNVTLPDVMLTETTVTTGAGKLTIEGLSSEWLELDLGAGESSIVGLTVSRGADIDGGAGRISIKDSMITALEFDMGVGEVDISASLYGENDLDCGVGDLDLELIGVKDSYSIHADKGVGSFTVDGDPVSDGQTVGTGDIQVNIDSGVGSVKVILSHQQDE